MEYDLNKSNAESIIDRFVNFIFSNDNRKWVILIFVAGLLLRIALTLRIPFNADEMVHGVHAIGFISSGKLQIMDQSAIWFWLSDLAMRLFSVNILGMRFLSMLWGSLTIIIVYLIGKQIWNEKIGLVAATIFAFSPYQFLEMRAEMDITMTFFILLAFYSFLFFLKNEQKIFFYLTWASAGIAVMAKPIALTFLPAFFIFGIWYNKKKFQKFKMKQFLYAAIILFFLFTPVLAFNYLLYKDKGIMDLQFARFTKIGFDQYASLASTLQPFRIDFLIFPHDGQKPGVVEGFKMFYDREAFIVILLALFGIISAIASKRYRTPFFMLLVLSFSFPFIFLSGTSLLSTHFVFGSAYLSLFAALGSVHLSSFAKKENFNKNILYGLIILIMVFSMIKTYDHASQGFFGKNELGKLIDLKESSIPENALVIADSRIYRGRIVFMLWDRHYLEASLLPQALNALESAQDNPVSVETFFIECIPDDCGWGTVHAQPEFNQSMENIIEFLANATQPLAIITDIEGKPYFSVYRKILLMKPQILTLADSTHEWFYYPVAYKPKDKIFDNYATSSSIDSFIDLIAHLVLYLEIFLSIIMVFIPFYLLSSSKHRDFSNIAG